MKGKRFLWFALGALFGLEGIKILSSKGAKKVYAHCTAGVLRAKDSVVDQVSVLAENCSDIYAEAKEPLTCIAIPIKGNQKILLENTSFLRLVGTSLAEKLDKISMQSAVPSTLEERILLFMRFICPDGCMKGVEKAAFHLHCSERQLQRLLNKLTTDGLIKKTGKGTYKLI